MGSVTIHAVRTTLSQLLARVGTGEEIIVARGKVSVAKLVPFHPPASKCRVGAFCGKADLGKEFCGALPEEELAASEK
jgi:antitoxin (DNA-binding transcriptional repressor) of toxin-antitoxin stability system